MNPKHIILFLLLMLCPIGMAAQSTITRNKPKPAVTKPKPAAKPKAKPKPAPRRNSTHHSSSTNSTTGLSAELNKLINNMVYVSGGTFTMGGTSEQGSDAYDKEKPTHNVTLSSYYICKYEVTQALWRAVMGSNPSHFEGDNLPVECVSWNTKENKWETKWTRADVSSPSMIPAVSTSSEMVFVSGWNDATGWEVTGLDWRTGTTRHRTILGKDNRANGAYAIIQFFDYGDLLYNSVSGPFRVEIK